jgi:Effector Associated Constant Component 1
MFLADNLKIELMQEGADPEELDVQVSRVRAELLTLDIDEVRRSRSDSPPPGARAMDAGTVTELVVIGLNSAALLTSVAQVLLAWVGRSAPRRASVTVGDKTFTLECTSAEEQGRILAEFVRSLGKSEA